MLKTTIHIKKLSCLMISLSASMPIFAIDDAVFDAKTGHLSLPKVLVDTKAYQAELVLKNNCFTLESATPIPSGIIPNQGERYTVSYEGKTWEDTPHSIDERGLTWHEAKDYCEELSLNGIDNWRLPSIMELNSIVYPGRDVHTVSVFNYAKNGSYWSRMETAAISGSGSPDDLQEAYIVDFHTEGYVNKNQKGTLFTRCISHTSTNGTIKEPTTEPTEATSCDNTFIHVVGEPRLSIFFEAQRYCESINAQVPSVEDLRRLYAQHDGAPKGFGGNDPVWTRDSVEGKEDNRWVVSFSEKGLILEDVVEKDLFLAYENLRMCVQTECY